MLYLFLQFMDILELGYFCSLLRRKWDALQKEAFDLLTMELEYENPSTSVWAAVNMTFISWG